MDAQAGGAHNLRAAQLARPGAAARAVRPVAVGAPVARKLALDRTPVTTHAPREAEGFADAFDVGAI